MRPESSHRVSASAPALNGRPALLEVEGLTVTYGTGKQTFNAVREVSFDVKAGEVLGIVGESGSGKSSVARALVRLAPARGRVGFDGVDWLEQNGESLRRLRPRMQMVFQDPYASLNPRMRVSALTVEPLEIHKVGTAAERQARALELLEMVGLSREQASRRPSALSGGQRQRVAIARALALNPTLLILDEPISALDVSIQAQVLNLLAELRQRFNLTYIFIVHDLVVAEYFCDRIVVMFGGRIVERGPSAAIFHAPAHPYTAELIAAVPVPTPGIRRRRSPLADGSSHEKVDRGCAYQHRCALRQGRDRCAVEVPELRETAGGQLVACHFAADMPKPDG